MTARTAARRLSHVALGGALYAVGCGEILGFDDTPSPSECVSNDDCGANQTCVNWTCRPSCDGDGCSGAAGGGGEGATSGGTSGGTNPMPPGGEGGDGAQGGGSGGGKGGGGNGGRGGTDPEPPGGAGGEAGIPDGGVCVPGTGQCLECDSTGHWVGGLDCPATCREDVGCVVPPSCNGLVERCGPNLDCCRSLAVPGGEFGRTCDDACNIVCEPPPEGFPASVTRFSLDAFEVTVGRLRRFVEAYPGSRPTAGMGKNPRNPEDSGWDAAWDSYLPATRDELRTLLLGAACSGATTWTADIELNESKPANCVSWYLAQAFCVWDGGRLPTQAEWNFVAAGGDEERVYPWSMPAGSTLIDSTNAVYASTAPEDVGLLPDGRGKWNHYDLGGNVLEWVFDVYEDCYRTPGQCNDCGYTSTDIRLRTARGGGYTDSEEYVRVAARQNIDDTAQFSNYGVRCARDL